MPYTWVEPPIFIGGILGCRTIYYAFRDNYADGNLLEFWYGVDTDDSGTLYFDVRDLPTDALVGVNEIPEFQPRASHALRILSAMRNPNFGFMEWLEEHGISEGEL